MGVGRTWHRVQAVGAASGGFEVETSQATATVRGTAFLVSCLTVESCDYSVMEGVVDVDVGRWDGGDGDGTGDVGRDQRGGHRSDAVDVGRVVR